MRNWLLCALLGVVVGSSNAYAKITPIVDYLRSDFYRYYHKDGANNNAACDGVTEQPANKVCDETIIDDLPCYTNCQCAPEFTEACSGTGEVGVGEACDGLYTSCTCRGEYETCGGVSIGQGSACTADGGNKYTACECPANYTQSCNGVGEVGVGSACEGRYTSCKCNSYYQKTCAAAAGDGEPCTADGVNKYASCDWGQYDGVSCRAVTDATPYYNSAEYIQHANAFQGIENTNALVEAHGPAAVAAYGTTQFKPAVFPTSATNTPRCTVSDGNEYLGVGNWYLPSAGEALYLIGANFNNMDDVSDHSALTRDVFTVVDGNMGQLFTKTRQSPGYVRTLHKGDSYQNSTSFWTSSEGADGYPYVFTNDIYNVKSFPSVNSARYKSGGYPIYYETRPVLMLQNCFNNANISVGDILYSNMTIGSIDSYNYYYGESCSHFPVGFVYWISPDKTLVRVISNWPVRYNSSYVPEMLGFYNQTYGVPFYVTSKSGYTSSEWNVSSVPDDVWGCSAISPDNSECVSTDMRRRKVFTCTPNDGSAGFAAHANAFKGIEYTNAIVAQHGSQGQAAYAASQFYPKSYSQNNCTTCKSYENDDYIGKGKWYLPSAGEALYLSGVDFNAMSSITDTTGINGNTFTAVEATLASGTLLYDFSGTPASYQWFNKEYISTFNTPSNGKVSVSSTAGASPRIWTSSEVDADNAYYWDSADGAIKVADKKNPEVNIAVRPVIMLKDADFIGNDPQIGDMVYTPFYTNLQGKVKMNDSWYSVAPLGIIYWVSDDKRIVRIISTSTIDIASGKYSSNTGNPTRAAAKWLKSGDAVDIADIPNNIWDNVPYGQRLKMGVLHDGRGNTAAAVAQIGNKALAASSANQFYAPGVAADDANFGQGKWYIPAIGEWMDLYGYNWAAVSENIVNGNYGDNVAGVGDNIALVNAALSALSSSGVTAAPLGAVYWSSSENDGTAMCGITTDNGDVVCAALGKSSALSKTRVSTLIENRFISNPVKPIVGDVMYSDLSYGAASGYDGSKIPVGVVYWVSADGYSARVINLKNLTVKYNYSDGTKTFYPDAPYTQNNNAIHWEENIVSGVGYSFTDITAIENLKNKWVSAVQNMDKGTNDIPVCE